LTLEDGAFKLSQNVSKELSLHAALYLTGAQLAYGDLAMQTLLWLCMVWFSTL